MYFLQNILVKTFLRQKNAEELMTSVTVTVHFIKHYWYDKNRCLNTDGVRAVGCGEFDIKNTMIQQVLQQSVQCAVVIRWHLFVLKPSFL